MIAVSGTTPRRPALRKGEKAVALLLLTAGFASILPGVAPAWWLADLCSHFRVQWVAIGLFAACFCAVRRRLMLFAVSLALIVINAFAIAPIFASGLPSHPPASGLRVVFANIYYRNPHADRVIAFVLASRADVVVLAEVTPQWKKALEPLDREYPYQHYSWLPGQRRTGLLLLSRWPMEGAATLGFGRTGDPGVIATIEAGPQVLHVIGVHPTWPLWRISTLYRNSQFRRIAELAHAQGKSTIVVGDFNATGFSPAFRSFVAASGLSSAAKGRGWLPTWPTFFPPLYLQIDHALVSPDVQVARFARGPRVGSDHLPIVVDLAKP